MDPSDHELLARVLARDDRHAYGELVRRHQSAVRSFLRRLTGGDHALADDLAQETFIEAFRSLSRYRAQAGFCSWLLGIAYNRFRQQRRRARPTESLDAAGALDAPTDAAYASMPDHALDVARSQDLNAALAALTAEEQVALELCYQADLSHAEAATSLGWPLGTLKSHVARAKDKLRLSLRAWAPASLSHPRQP